MRLFLGLVLVLIPGSLIFYGTVLKVGFLMAVGIWAGSIVLTAMIAAGIWLLIP